MQQYPGVYIEDESDRVALDDLIKFRLVESAPGGGGRLRVARPFSGLPRQESGAAHAGAFERHADYYSRLFVRLEEDYRRGGEPQAAAIERFDRELPNFEWCLNKEPLLILNIMDTPSGAEEYTRFAQGMGGLARLRVNPAARSAWMQNLEAVRERLTSEDVDVLIAERVLALDDCGRIDDVRALGRPFLASSGSSWYTRIVYVRAAEPVTERTQPIFRKPSMPSETHPREAELSSVMKWYNAQVAIVHRNIPLAREELGHALVYARNARDIRFETDARLFLAELEAEDGNPPLAEIMHREMLRFAESFRDDRGAALASWHLGRLAARQGEVDHARELMHTLVEYRRSIGHAMVERTQSLMNAVLAEPAMSLTAAGGVFVIPRDDDRGPREGNSAPPLANDPPIAVKGDSAPSAEQVSSGNRREQLRNRIRR